MRDAVYQDTLLFSFFFPPEKLSTAQRTNLSNDLARDHCGTHFLKPYKFPIRQQGYYYMCNVL